MFLARRLSLPTRADSNDEDDGRDLRAVVCAAGSEKRMKLKVPCGRNVKQPGRPVGRQRSQKVRARRATAALMVKRVQRSAPRDPPESTRSATWLLPQSSDGCRRAVSARARLRCTPGRPRGLRLAVVAHGAPCGRGRARGQAPPRHGKTTNSLASLLHRPPILLHLLRRVSA